MTAIQQEILDSINYPEKVYQIMESVRGERAFAYALYLIKYFNYDADKLMRIFKKESDEDFIRTLKLKAFL